MEDAKGIATEANDKEIAENIASVGSFPNPYTMDDAVSFVQNALKGSIEGREFHFAVKMQSDGVFVGMCGIMGIDNVNHKAEIGYWIGKKYWGNSYAKQAVRLLLDVAFERLGLNRVYASTFASNERSIRLLKSVGFTMEGNLRESSMIATGNDAKLMDEKMFGMLKKEYSQTGAKFEQ